MKEPAKEIINVKCEYKEKADGKFEIECHRTIDKENLCQKYCTPKKD